jgi:hypothetical protein
MQVIAYLKSTTIMTEKPQKMSWDSQKPCQESKQTLDKYTFTA